MKRLRILILALFGWFFVFYNIERLIEPINIASFVYLLAPALGMTVLCVPYLHKVRWSWYVPLSFCSVIALRAAFGYEIVGHAFSLAVTETLATWITIGLSYQLAQGICEYQSAAATAICSHLTDRCRPLEEAQAEVVREVRRARQSKRPIAVLALSPQPQDGQQTLDRFTDDFKNRILRQYVSARTAECLSTRLRHHDILTETKDEFLALLPELSREEAAKLAADMRRDLREQIGVDLKFCISMFPEDEVTAIGLIERAESESQKMWAMAATAPKRGTMQTDPPQRLPREPVSSALARELNR
jgi:hypothetical protein